MERIYLEDLKKHFNEEITLNGFVDNVRNLQYVKFVILRDYTGKVQITIEKNDDNKELVEIVNGLTNESTIKVKLEGLAYTDALTNISNRSKCELALAELSGEYTIVSIDLDYLKYTNDNYGHSEGDKLLKGFAGILTNSFTDASLLGRMGGDEFIVIVPYIDEARLERDFTCMNDLMNFRNGVDAPLKYSASYGYAYSNDPQLGDNASAQKVYLLADARMYKMKNTHHKQSLGRLYDDLISHGISKGGSENE